MKQKAEVNINLTFIKLTKLLSYLKIYQSIIYYKLIHLGYALSYTDAKYS